jgi:Tfp pilus assembly protein PilV
MRSSVCGPWSAVSRASARRPGAWRRGRSGITLTEILIAIMIMGIGLVSLATLFPIGLLRLRDAARWSRSATLFETAASDAISRGLFSSQSFATADYYNYYANPKNPSYWYYPTTWSVSGGPLVVDSAYYGADPLNTTTPGVDALLKVLAGGPGLPFAYDPLWRWQTVGANGSGYYLDPVNGTTLEARFGYGLTTVGTSKGSVDYDGNGTPSAHGLQRITNFHPLMPGSLFVPNIFVSQEDLVWQNPDVKTYTINGISTTNGGVGISAPSPVVPDLSPPANLGQGVNGGSPSLDWRYSWMFTGQLTNASNDSTFDGNIVIFENRPFAIQTPASTPYTPGGNYASYQVDGEIVVEGIFGYSGNIIGPGGPGNTPGYGTGADRTVLLRWPTGPTGMPDPVVRPGDWIADVTYERSMATMVSRFFSFASYNTQTTTNPAGLEDYANKLEWDNLPAQRCFWYQVQKATQPTTDPTLSGYRSMVVFVNQNMQARTILSAAGTPQFLNAALIVPNVVNVIPTTIFVR